jgi:GH24 family phage-related lysozyme (muramidase)
MKKISDAGAKLVARFEGCRLTAYKDVAGIWTIGYGHTGYVKFFKKNVCAGMTITQDQAVELLKDDLSKFEAPVNKYDSKYSWNQNEFDALVSFALNNGSIDELTKFGTRTRSVIASKILEYNKAKVDGVLQEVPGLTTRRKAEQTLFLTGCLDTETELPVTHGLTSAQIANNIKTVQKWLNENYGNYIKACKLCGNKLLTVDGKNGNKTRAALTIALQLYLNDLGAKLVIDGDYGTSTNKAVLTYIKYVELGNETLASKIVQAVLQIYGYNPQLFYPLFNQDCVDALVQCQDDHNLNDDGKAGVVFFKTFLEQRIV